MSRNVHVHDGDTPDEVVIEGYAATYEPYEWPAGDSGGWVEQIPRETFAAALAENPDMGLTVNFDGPPIARTADGTLQVEADEHGLKIRATIGGEPGSNQAERAARLRALRDDDEELPDRELEISFRAKDQQWDDDYRTRRLLAISFDKTDIGLVSIPDQPGEPYA